MGSNIKQLGKEDYHDVHHILVLFSHQSVAIIALLLLDICFIKKILNYLQDMKI